MTMVKTLVIWDWDNTLADTREAVKAGLNDTLKHYGFPPVTPQEVVAVMGTHRGNFWHDRFADVPAAVSYYVSCYRKYTSAVRLFEDSLPVLNFIKEHGVLQVLVSNKDISALVDEVKEKRACAYFDVVLGTSSPLGKPEKAYVQPILDKYNPEKIIVIGDGESDMKLAQNIGATGILVRHFNPELPHDYFFKDFKELPNFLASKFFKESL